jgi:hypothetical protein
LRWALASSPASWAGWPTHPLKANSRPNTPAKIIPFFLVIPSTYYSCRLYLAGFSPGLHPSGNTKKA